MDLNTKDCDYTPRDVLYLMMLPQIFARTCLSSTTYINWFEIVWKGARPNLPPNSTEQTGHGSLKMFQTACSVQFCQVHIWFLPAWGHPRNICSPGIRQMIMLYNMACQKSHPLCELMPNQAPYDISLSISKKPDCKLTESICLLNYFDGLETLKYRVAKRGGKAFEGKCQGFSLVNYWYCYSSSTISPVPHYTRHGIGMLQQWNSIRVFKGIFKMRSCILHSFNFYTPVFFNM